MVDRILEVLKVKQLSPSQFAEEIGVQRSNISHLISGRNKPSLEFIQKIIKRFPDINPDYLLSGEGKLFRNGSQTEIEFSAIPVPEVESEVELPSEPARFEPERPSKRKNVSTGDNPVEKLEKTKKEDKIEKIVFFYKNQTFKEYFPE